MQRKIFPSMCWNWSWHTPVVLFKPWKRDVCRSHVVYYHDEWQPNKICTLKYFKTQIFFYRVFRTRKFWPAARKLWPAARKSCPQTTARKIAGPEMLTSHRTINLIRFLWSSITCIIDSRYLWSISSNILSLPIWSLIKKLVGITVSVVQIQSNINLVFLLNIRIIAILINYKI